jgi:hypothetical protein
MNEELAEVSAVFRAPLESLIDEEYRIAAGEWVYGWDLPAESQRALAEWGFPRGFNLTPDFQHDVKIIDTPSDAVEFGVSSDSLCVLGAWVTNIGSSSSHLACVETGGGRVLSVDLDPAPVESYPSWFWAEYPGFEVRNSRFIGSSVEKICELAWRWHALWDLVHSVQLPDRPTNSEVDEYFRKKEGMYSAIREEVAALDPLVLGEPESRYPWVTVLGDLSE